MTLETNVDHSHDADHGQYGHRDQCIADNPSKAKWIIMVCGVYANLLVYRYIIALALVVSLC